MVQRCGPLPEWARERVESLDSAELEQLAGLVLTANPLQELLA